MNVVHGWCVDHLDVLSFMTYQLSSRWVWRMPTEWLDFLPKVAPLLQPTSTAIASQAKTTNWWFQHRRTTTCTFGLGPPIDKRLTERLINPWLSCEDTRTKLNASATTTAMTLWHPLVMRRQLNSGRPSVNEERPQSSLKRKDDIRLNSSSYLSSTETFSFG